MAAAIRAGLAIVLVAAVPRLALSAPLAQETGDQAPEREFLSGYAGSLPQDPRLLARTYFEDAQVRALIYRLESGPLQHAAVEKALESTAYSIEDLLRVNILAERDGKYSIGFSYFTRADMEAVYAEGEKYVPALVDGFMHSKPDFDEIFARYPPDGVPRNLLAYVLVAGFALNWDALDVLEEDGYRQPRLVEGDAGDGAKWQYSFWASEIVPDYSTKGFFWGSSTFPAGPFNLSPDPLDYTYSSYGDPYSDPRMNFPDLFYLPTAAMSPEVKSLAEAVGLRDEEFFGNRLTQVIGLERARSVGKLLFALRQKPQNLDQLQTVVDGPDRAVVEELLALLVEIQYVEAQPDGRYRLRMPVLDLADRPMVNDALALARRILTGWLDQNYRPIRSDLGGLTAVGQGVPYESLFTQIWHDFFGLATRQLVEKHFMADPYGDSVKYKGSLGVLWRASLYNFNPH